VSDAGFATPFIATSPLWHPLVWVVLGIAGVTVFSLYTVTWVGWARDWLRQHKQRRSQSEQSGQARSDDPALFLYAPGLLLALPPFVFSPVHFDRYMLPLIPMLMLPSLRRIDIGTRHT